MSVRCGSRTWTRGTLGLAATCIALATAAPALSADTRKQPLLRVTGKVDEAKGGFVIGSVVADGPGERLVPTGGGKAYKLREGDVITEVEGVTPADFRDFQDLLHYSFRQNKGKVTLTVRPGGSDAAKGYTAVPEEAEVELVEREKKVGLPADLDKPRPTAPAPPVVPPHVKP